MPMLFPSNGVQAARFRARPRQRLIIRDSRQAEAFLKPPPSGVGFMTLLDYSIMQRQIFLPATERPFQYLIRKQEHALCFLLEIGQDLHLLFQVACVFRQDIEVI